MTERQLSSTDSWVRWVLDDCPEDSISYVLRYFGPHKRRFENLLRANYVLNPELTLQLNGQLGGRGWRLHAVLKLPTGILVAQASDETLMGTMDQALDSLGTNLKHHLGQPLGEGLAAAPARQERSAQRQRSRSDVLAPATG